MLRLSYVLTDDSAVLSFEDKENKRAISVDSSHQQDIFGILVAALNSVLQGHFQAELIFPDTDTDLGHLQGYVEKYFHLSFF